MQLQVVTPLSDARAHWVTQAWRQFVEQATLFLRTTRALLLRPRAFFLDWAEGSHRSLSPIAYFAASLAVLGPVIAIFKYLAGVQISSQASLIGALVAPYFEFVGLGLLAHLALKALTRTEPWPMSLAVALFAGGGPAALADCVAAAVRIVPADSALMEALTAAGILAMNGVFIGVLVAGLSAVHNVKWWKPLLAWAVAQLVWSALKVAVMYQVMT